MPPVIRSIYSNVVNIQTTDTELILEFGANFPSSAAGQPVEFVPEVRIVLPKSGTQHFVDEIVKAVTSGTPSASNKGPASARKAK